MRIKIFSAICTVAIVSAGYAQGTKQASAGIFTDAQASRGAALYGQQCASCHGASLNGQDMSPPLAGAAFLRNWSGKSVADLSFRIRTTMPFNAPGTLGTAATADITAYLFQANGYHSGAAELPASPSAQRAITIDARPR